MVLSFFLDLYSCWSVFFQHYMAQSIVKTLFKVMDTLIFRPHVHSISTFTCVSESINIASEH